MKEINSIVKLALCVFIFKNLISILTSIIKLPSGFYDPSIIIFSIIQSIIVIAILINMLRVRTWALYAFFIFQALNAILLTLIEDGNFMYDLGKHSVTAVILSAIMSVILLIKKNGISAWKVFLSNDSAIDGTMQAQLDAQEKVANIQAKSSNLSENQVENKILPPAGENIISPYEVPDAITEVNPAPEPIQEQKPVLPLDEKGNILYHKMPVEDTIADLTDGTLDDNEIDSFIAANKAEAGKLLKKVSESAPKISTNKAKYLADKKAWQEKVADAQARVDYWNFIDERKVFYQSAKVGDEKINKIQVKKRVENTFANPIMKKESPTKRKERNIFSIVALIFVSCIIVVIIVFHAINGENSYRESENKMLVNRDSIRRADSIIALEAAAAEAAMDLSNPKDGIDELYEMMLQHYSSDSLKPKSEFRKWASDENNRKELYQAFKEDCPDIFSSQSEFDKYLGF